MCVYVCMCVHNHHHKQVIAHHRDNGNMKYMMDVARIVQAASPNTLIFLTVSESLDIRMMKSNTDKTKGKGKSPIKTRIPGFFFMLGPIDVVKAVGPEVAKILHGRGGGKNGRFQGKAQNLGATREAIAYLKEHVK